MKHFAEDEQRDLVARGLARLHEGRLIPVIRGGDHEDESEDDDRDDGGVIEVRMTKEVRQTLDELKSTWESQLKKVSDDIATETKARGEASAETKQLAERVQDELDKIELRFQKLRLEQPDKDEPSEGRKAFETLLRRGAAALDEEERSLISPSDGKGELLKRAMELSDDTEGGFFAPEELVDEIVKGITEFSPMREICRVRSTVRRSVRFPKRTQVAGAVWVGETDTRTETQNPKWAREEIGTRELSAMADLSRQDLEDTAVDLEELVYDEIEEQFGVAEATAFVAGDGVDGKPEGFLTAADTGYLAANGIYTLTSGTNDVIAADDLIKLYFELKDPYARNASWVMKRSTLRDIRLLKDTGAGNYLWQPGLAGVSPATILDQPYVQAIDMPAIADAALAVALGDFRRGYLIVDRLVIETLRDPYTQAGTGYIRIWARKRTGGAVVLPEAIKLLQIA